MKKPKPVPENHKFASKAERDAHFFNCMCWVLSEDMSLECDMPHEDCADFYKKAILDGRLIVELDEKNDRIRAVLSPTFTRHEQ